MKAEKLAVVAAVECEEEAITNLLQRQMTTLLREKEALERELAHEHEERDNAVARLTLAFTERLAERSKLNGERCLLENALEVRACGAHVLGTPSLGFFFLDRLSKRLSFTSWVRSCRRCRWSATP